MRPGEAWNLKYSDIDQEQHVADVTPEKHSRPRRLPISNRFLAMLGNLPCAGNYLFRNSAVDPLNSLEDFTRNFELQRKNLARKLQNPRITKISFRTLRHWKATTLYHKTKDILLVQRTLGHKNIQNTLVYTHLIDFQDDDYICKAARTVEEATGLLEQGFDFMLEIDNIKLFRKRK
jgi:integrase